MICILTPSKKKVNEKYKKTNIYLKINLIIFCPRLP